MAQIQTITETIILCDRFRTISTKFCQNRPRFVEDVTKTFGLTFFRDTAYKAALERDGGRPATDWVSRFVMTSLYVSVPPRCWSAGAASTTARRGGGVGAGVQSEDASKSASKVRVEDGVDERIKKTIDVADSDDVSMSGSSWKEERERCQGFMACQMTAGDSNVVSMSGSMVDASR